MNRPEPPPTGRQKVSHISTVHPAFDVRIFHKECRSLARAGFDVSVVVTHVHDEVVDQVSIVSLPRASNRAIRMLVNPFLALHRALRTEATLFHIHDPELMPVGLLLKLFGKKVIYDAHEDLPRQVMSKEWIPPVLRGSVAAVVDAIETFTARRLDGVVAATPTIAARYARHQTRTATVNNYPRIHELNEPSEWKDRENAVCYIGSISLGRGIREMMLALQYCDVSMHLAGNFSPAELRAEIELLPGWEKVRYHGYVGRLEIGRLLARCKVGLVCLHPEPNHIDSQPTKLFEYMSAGIPVVASNFEAWARLVTGTRCGICVDPGNPRAIAEAVDYLMTHEDRAREMGENGRRAIEQSFNWEGEQQKLIELYRSLLGEESPVSIAG